MLQCSTIHTLEAVTIKGPAKKGVALSQAPIAREAPDSRDFLERQISNLPRSHEPCHRRIYAYIYVCKAPSQPSKPIASRPRRTGPTAAHGSAPSPTSERRSASATICRQPSARRRAAPRHKPGLHRAGSGAHAPLRTLCQRVRPVIVRASSPSSSSGPEHLAPALAAGNRPQLPADAPRRPRDRRGLCPNPKGLKVAGSNPTGMDTF